MNTFENQSTKMKLKGAKKLEKLAKKNQGNEKLEREIKEFIDFIENGHWQNPVALESQRPDADNVESDGFYFFNLEIHRTLIKLDFETQIAEVVWTGTHEEYEDTFKNNRSTIKKWLHTHQWI